MKSLFTIIAAILSFFILSSCGSEPANQQATQRPGNFRGSQPASVEVVPVQIDDISDQVSSYGTIQAQSIVSITPQVSNRVTNIYVDLGDNVSQGQLMAKIRDVTFRDEVEQAEAQVSQARANLERDSTQFSRQQELFERDLISRSEYDEFRTTFLNSRSQYESATAALTQSRENLANTEIRSPVNGVVLERFISVGDVATTGQPAFDVANLVGFETRVFLPIQDWELVQVGQPVSMSLSSRTGVIAQGVVSRISPRLDPVTGLGEVVITITDTERSIYQGALVQTKINLETRENVVTIPRSALVEKVDTYIEPETGTIELARTYSAFIIQGDSVAVRRELTLGIEQGDRIEIVEGLSEGDGLIITGQSNLEDGSRIRVAGQNIQTPQTVTSDSTTVRQQRGAGAGNAQNNR
ncbi:MAG: efflux RND transporter periplasmic adaptor subunit [Balneolaceae bacterium]